jgi:tetratricopeptide (TPR) repeat protein
MAAAANLLRRAAGILPQDDPQRLELLPDLGEAMMEIGEFAWAELFLDEALAGATALGDESLRADARLTQLLVQHHVTEDLGAWRDDIERETSALIPILEEREAARELAKAWRMVAFLHATVCLWEAAASAQQRALGYARTAGDRRQEARLSSAYAYALCDGPTPVPEAIGRCEEILERDLGHRQSEAIVLCSLATLLALDGRFDEARATYVRARTLLEDLGAAVFAASTSLTSARVELLAGNASGAEKELRRDHERLEAMGELYFRPLVAGLLAQVLYIRGAAEEAQTFAEIAEQLAADDDVELQALLRSLRAHASAERGAMADAVAAAREGVAILPKTEAPVIRVEALLDLARLFERAGDTVGAESALEEAAALCALKQMRVLADRAEALRAEILPSTAARAV